MRRLNSRKRIVVTVLGISCGIFSSPPLLGRQTAKLPEWKANQALLSQLENAIRVDGFSIRAPKGYSLQTRSGPNGSKVAAWVGPQRADGTRGQVMLLTVTLPPEELKHYNLEQVLNELITGLSDRRKDWTQTAAEKGLINGLRFVRTRWSGRNLSNDVAMKGFVYVAIAGETIVQLSSQDVESNEEALKLAESSILTFENGHKSAFNRGSRPGKTHGI
jgi:hypothetical protein